MKTLFRILGTAAAVAVTGAAIVALDKILNQKDPLHVEEVEFPEDAELDPKEAEKAAEAYAEARGQRRQTRPMQRPLPPKPPEAAAESGCCPARRRSRCPGSTRRGRREAGVRPGGAQPEPGGSRPRRGAQRRERKIRSHQDRRSQ